MVPNTIPSEGPGFMYGLSSYFSSMDLQKRVMIILVRRWTRVGKFMPVGGINRFLPRLTRTLLGGRNAPCPFPSIAQKRKGVELQNFQKWMGYQTAISDFLCLENFGNILYFTPRRQHRWQREPKTRLHAASAPPSVWTSPSVRRDTVPHASWHAILPRGPQRPDLATQPRLKPARTILSTSASPGFGLWRSSVSILYICSCLKSEAERTILLEICMFFQHCFYFCKKNPPNSQIFKKPEYNRNIS